MKTLRRLRRILGDKEKVEHLRVWHLRKLKVTHTLRATYQGHSIVAEYCQSIFWPTYSIVRAFYDMVNATKVLVDSFVDDKDELKKILNGIMRRAKKLNLMDYIAEHFCMSLEDFRKELAKPNLEMTDKRLIAVKKIMEMDRHA